ncbi:MAG TPA: hypothetical protein VFD71_01090, partial [Planctomycetota bacterium]|nr:hypothetical protein [Planctomycetota bacterium]
MMVNRALSARGVALIMVLLVLSILAIIGAPFVISMSLQDKSSLNFSGAVAAREAARAAANHAIVHLEKTTYGYEFEEEEEVLDSERPAGSLRRDNRGTKSSSVPRRSTAKHGLVRRKDQGEKETRQLASSGRTNRFARTASGRNSVQSSEKDGGKDKEKEPRLPEALRQSQKGPSPRDFDLTDELVSKPLDAVSLPAGSEPSQPVASASTTFVASAIRQEFRFQDPTGISASAVVTDEQGKINLNTAPPNLLANLFAVSQLAQPLTPQAEKVFLDDASAFPGDDDPASLDGAVVIVDADVGCVEAVTYRKKAGDVLDDCFRGAFLSLVLNHTYPVGSFVYDLRGWKAAYHRLWAQDEGGFHPRTLHAFTSVESIREIAGWQIASLFVTRFRGEGFTAEFLSQMGVSLKKLSDVGLDPYLFAGAGVDEGPELKKRYEEARKALRKVGFKSDLVTRLKDSRGARVVIDLAAQLDGADKQRIDKVEEALEKSIAADKRAAPRIPEKYLNEALRQLVEAYKTPGIETVGPEELEWLRDCVTTSSWLPAQWSESQSVLDDVLIAGKELSARVARANEINPWTIVRIRSQADPSFVEFNEAAPLGNQIPHGGMRFAFPLRASLKGYDATVQALERHPVNANTAGRRVLRAVFTGVRGYEKDQVVSPYEADRLAVR